MYIDHIFLCIKCKVNMSYARYNAEQVTKSTLQDVVNTSGNLENEQKILNTEWNQQKVDSSQMQQAAESEHARVNIHRHAAMVSSVNTGIDSNRYIELLLKKEGRRINDSDSMLKNKQLKMRNIALENAYLLRYYQNSTKTAIATFYILLFMLLLVAFMSMGYLSNSVFWGLVVALLLIYLILVLYWVRRTASYATTSDGVIRWKVSSKVKGEADKAGSCGNPQNFPNFSCGTS